MSQRCQDVLMVLVLALLALACMLFVAAAVAGGPGELRQGATTGDRE